MLFHSRMVDSNRLAAAMTLGAVAGMRAFMAPAAVAARLARRPWSWRRNRAERLLRKRSVRRFFLVMAAAELAGDKLPFIGDRIAAGPLAARAASGALAGWSVARRREAAPQFAVAGAAAAIATAYVAWRLRRFIATESVVPDAIAGIYEDVVAIALARGIRFP